MPNRGLRENDLAGARALAEKSLQLADSLEYHRGSINSLVEIARVHRLSGHYDSARVVLGPALRLARKIKSRKAEASVNNRIGRSWMAEGRYAKALEHYQIAQRIFLEEEIDEGIAVTANNLAIIYKYQLDDSSAAYYYRQAMARYKGIGKVRGIVTASINLSQIFNEHRQLDSAETYLLDALALTQNHGLKYREALVRSMLADTWTYSGDLRRAKKEADKAIAILEGLEVPGKLGGTYLKRANILKEEKKWAEAEKWVLNSLEISRKIGAVEAEKTGLALLWVLEDKQGRHKEAVRTLARFKQLDDSLRESILNRGLMAVREQFEVEKKEKEIAEMQLMLKESRLAEAQKAVDLEKQELANRKSRLRLWLVLGVAAILAFLAVFLFLKIRDNQRHRLLLEEKNQLTEDSLREKETLLAEIHHRVKNNLQLVYNMLDLQSRGLEEEKSRSAIKESMNRVASMALVHRKLYDHDHRGGIQMRDYLEELMKDLLKSYLPEELEMDSRLEVEDLILDIDTAIPLGLIVNELVTNAFKYAYTGKEKGRLWLRLRRNGEALRLEVEDDGRGISPKASGEAGGFGTRLVRSLSRQLKADFDLVSGKGTLARLEIRKFRTAEL